MRAKTIIVASSLVALISGAALAQQPLGLPQGLPPLPPAAPAANPVQPAQQPVFIRPFQNAEPVPTGAPAPIPAQPEGGYGTTLPTPGAADPASRMNLNNAAGYSGRVQDEARTRLSEFTRQDASPATTQKVEGQGPLGMAPVSSQSDLEALSRIQRNIAVLDAQNKEAELAVKLWATMFNNPAAKEWREAEKKEKEEAAKQAAAAAAPLASAMPGVGQPSQQAQMPTPDPLVVEVSGNRARLLLPGRGEIVVRAGQTIPEGRIASVGLSGVVLVDNKGNRTTLGFGTSFPMANNTPPASGFARPISR
ncbi:hypothetical protein [Bosea sp. RAC05]|uniref:hypothetical protein n=1 Tax=Bosea sp. RAC05 TaxID=1842539 RepID=UPI00083D12E7|nr:hypothetical protein [Bosea sp. RAC05]AOG03101.1 hypothetical protein BSY19_5241 [Bosea sp. RAC05]